MRWHRCAPKSLGTLGHNRVLRMKAKRNRYDLSLWDVRKLQLYGRSRDSVQTGDSQEQSFGRLETDSSHRMELFELRGPRALSRQFSLPQPRRNKTWPSCPCR